MTFLGIGTKGKKSERGSGEHQGWKDPRVVHPDLIPLMPDNIESGYVPTIGGDRKQDSSKDGEEPYTDSGCPR